MYYKLFVFLFCANVLTQCCAEIKSERVKRLIEDYIAKLKRNEDKLVRPSLPSYLNMDQLPSSSSTDTINLTRHHLVSGSRLNTLFSILLKYSPETLIEIFRSIFFNLPPSWRDDIVNVEFLQAIWCLDETVADNDIVDLEKCNDAIENLRILFYWRPDNIQIGPTQRFRDNGDGYDYDCFYLLRGVEMVYNIEFREAVEDVIADHAEINVNRLVRASRNMIMNRNVPRNYDPNEWIEVDINFCAHNKPYRNSLNILENAFDLKHKHIKLIDRAQNAMTLQSINRLLAWTESVLSNTQINNRNRLRRLADQMKVEQRNTDAFTSLMLDFIKKSEIPLNVEEFMDFIYLYSGNAITPSSFTVQLWEKLYFNYISPQPIMDQVEINVRLKNWNNNKKLLSIFNTLKIHRGRDTSKAFKSWLQWVQKSYVEKGYQSSIHNIIKYNTYFMNLYLDKELNLNVLYNLQNCIDTDNVTSTVKDFKELRKKKDDDDEERDKKKLSSWYELLMGVNDLYIHKICVGHLGENVQNIIDSKKCPFNGDNDTTTYSLVNIMEQTKAVETMSPEIMECSATYGKTVRTRAERDVSDSEKQKQQQLRELVEDVFQNINSTYPYDRATVLYQMVANQMHPLIKDSLLRVCPAMARENKHIDPTCAGYRYPGCYWDQPVVEKATIIMDKMFCHGLNIATFGIGYLFNTC